MRFKRRLFVSSITAIVIAGIQQCKIIANAQESKGWFNELTSTIKGSIAFVDDVRAALKRQGTEIDRQKLKPSVSELNMAVNALLSSLTSLRKTIDRKDSKDNEIAFGASNLSPRANRMVRAMEDMFRRMSSFDTSLEKHRTTIYQFVAARSEAVERIRTITIKPAGGKIDRMALRTELNGAIKIGNSLLQSIQSLIKELG
jgi:hypothetical protein